MPNETSIMEQVLAFHDKYDFNSFTAKRCTERSE